MFTFSRRPTLCRHSQARRPQLETCEGRQLLSGIVGNHIGVATAAGAPVGSHIGTSVVAQAILKQGGHLGTSVADYMRKH